MFMGGLVAFILDNTVPGMINFLSFISISIWLFVFIIHSWSDRLNYATDDVTLTVTPVSQKMHKKNEVGN